MCFSSSSGIGPPPPKTETPASSIIWFPLGFGDTSKFGSSSVSNGWDLWQGFHSEPLEFVPDVPSTGFWGPQHPMWIWGVPSVSSLPFKDSPIHQEAQNSAGPLLVYFASRLFSWGSEPLKGGGESRQGVVEGGSADHTNSATARITTGGTMNEDHICQARHKRRPRQSQTQTSRQRWGSRGPLALHVQRILGRWVEFAYLEIAVRGRKVGVWVPGEQKGPSSGRTSRCD